MQVQYAVNDCVSLLRQKENEKKRGDKKEKKGEKRKRNNLPLLEIRSLKSRGSPDHALGGNRLVSARFSCSQLHQPNPASRFTRLSPGAVPPPEFLSFHDSHHWMRAHPDPG